MNTSWDEAVAAAFQGVWVEVAQALPQIVVALLVFLIGWIIAALLAKVVRRLARAMKANKALDYLGAKRLERETGMTVDVPRFLGWVVKWFFIIVFLLAALDVLGLEQITIFLQSIAFDFLPSLIVATLIIVIGGVVANAAKSLVVSMAKSAGIDGANMLGWFVRWAVLTFAVLAALYQVGIATALVQTLFAGIVFAVSLALGLAFGLGGREHASAYIEKLKRNLK